jgi:PleD family two-component response regulator
MRNGLRLPWRISELANAPFGMVLRILVAEDNPTNQKLIVTLLSRQGHDVVLAADGREAMERASRACCRQTETLRRAKCCLS